MRCDEQYHQESEEYHEKERGPIFPTTRIENRWLEIDGERITMLMFISANEITENELDNLLNLNVEESLTLEWMDNPQVTRIG